MLVKDAIEHTTFKLSIVDTKTPRETVLYNICMELVTTASLKNPHDNLTCVLIEFGHKASIWDHQQRGTTQQPPEGSKLRLSGRIHGNGNSNPPPLGGSSGSTTSKQQPQPKTSNFASTASTASNQRNRNSNPNAATRIPIGFNPITHAPIYETPPAAEDYVPKARIDPNSPTHPFQAPPTFMVGAPAPHPHSTTLHMQGNPFSQNTVNSPKSF